MLSLSILLLGACGNESSGAPTLEKEANTYLDFVLKLMNNGYQ